MTDGFIAEHSPSELELRDELTRPWLVAARRGVDRSETGDHLQARLRAGAVRAVRQLAGRRSLRTRDARVVQIRAIEDVRELRPEIQAQPARGSWNWRPNARFSTGRRSRGNRSSKMRRRTGRAPDWSTRQDSITARCWDRSSGNLGSADTEAAPTRTSSRSAAWNVRLLMVPGRGCSRIRWCSPWAQPAEFRWRSIRSR